MELLSPAGNAEKLYYAYSYGADAAYIGLKKFSLRVKADNFYNDEYKRVCEIKEKFPGKRLHCALNISFHNKDIENLKQNIDYFKLYPIDAFIVQDLGIVPLLQKYFPSVQLHLSTQASCVNSESVKMYKAMGFSRIVLGREATLDEIKQIKDAVPDIELEAFCHGAMCIAYAGRCLMSAYMNGRSAQEGLCSHSCRWNYDVLVDGKRLQQGDSAHYNADESAAIARSGALVLQERSRPDELYPIFEGDDFSAVLSSKDLRMIEHLEDMKNAGIDSIKIEGRMKSIYYVALVTQAYRKAVDLIDGKISKDEADLYIAELENVSHRESTTGFYYSRTDADKTTLGAADSAYLLAAKSEQVFSEKQAEELYSLGYETIQKRNNLLENMHPEARAARLRDYKKHPEKAPAAILKKEGWKFYKLELLNRIDTNMTLEFIQPNKPVVKALPGTWQLADTETGTEMGWVCNGHEGVLYTSIILSPQTLVRIVDPDYIPGQIRDTGR